ncbi:MULTISPECIES: dTMP kinase [Candidatus Cardinium]|uniref:dTMP kinase n=1 Tax=Candidatus Cardinium TaxID=273135 RepID=UPI001FA96A8B|nr:MULTISPECIES: dTMP kinase [Cardinium]
MKNLTNRPSHRPFILAIEGVDFSGKTTLAHQIQSSLRSQSYRVKLLHDPKGSKNATIIWNTILDLKKNNGAAITELFLFVAARHELIQKEALASDVDVIIFDRFIFSTIAYQLTNQPDYWEPFLTTHRVFSGLMPDLCIYCDIDLHHFQLRNQTRSKQDAFDAISQQRFEAIKQAYEQAFQRKICPYFRISQQDNDFSALIKTIIAHLASQETDLKSI